MPERSDGEWTRYLVFRADVLALFRAVFAAVLRVVFAAVFVPLACERSLAATDFTAALERPPRSRPAALDATPGLVFLADFVADVRADLGAELPVDLVADLVAVLAADLAAPLLRFVAGMLAPPPAA